MALSRKVKSLIVLGIIFLFILGAGVVLRSIILQQVKKQIQPNLNYSHIYLKIFPPTLIIDDVRSISTSPFFSAGRISIRLSIQSLFSREKPFHVLIEKPILRVYAPLSDQEAQAQEPIQLNLPFSLERGWIRNGELYYWGTETRLQALNINASFDQRRDQYSLLAESKDVSFFTLKDQKPVQGRIGFFVEGRGNEVDVKKLKISSPSGVFRAKGTLVDPLDPEINLTSSFDFKSDLVARLLKLPFFWKGRGAGQGTIVRKDGEITFNGNFSSRTIELNGVDMGRVNGTVDFSQKQGGKVDVQIQRQRLPSERLDIRFKDRIVRGQAFGVHVDPVMDFLALPWPVLSDVWGNFRVEKKRLNVEAELRENLQEEIIGFYPLQGQIRVNWDGRKAVTFSSESLVTPFADVRTEGVVHIGQSMDILIQGDVKDVNQTRQFSSEILNREFGFPEIRGAGEADFRIYGDFFSPDIRAEFSLSPAGFDQFDVQEITGEVDVVGSQFNGLFNVDDPLVKGKILVLSDSKNVQAEIGMESGEVDYILPKLNISIPLKGFASGRFIFRQENEDFKVSGDFASDSLDFLGQPLKNAQGKLGWVEGTLSLSDLDLLFHDGRIQGSTLLSFSNQEFEMDIQADGVDLSSLVPNVEGILTLDLQGLGSFGQEYASGSFSIQPLHFLPFQPTEAQGKIQLGFGENEIDLSLDGDFLPGNNEFHFSLNIPLDRDSLSGEIRGNFSNLELLLPWEGLEGRLNYLGEIKGPARFLDLRGVIDFQGDVFPIPKFAHALREYSGLVFVENNTLTLRSLQGKMGGGDVQGKGTLVLGKGEVQTIDLEVEGQNLLLTPLERMRALAEGKLNLVKEEGRFVLDGDFLVHRLSWQRELDERFVFYSTPYYQSRREGGFFEDLNLNIRLRAEDDAWMENSLGRIRGRFDLNIAGNVKLPIVLGDIEALEGHVFFQDRQFDILRGMVSFSNPLTIEPYLSFTGETYVKDYRVTFSLDGLLDKLNPEFTSSPPLPPEDVLALLALGESFRRTYHHDRSTQQSTASLVSFQLSERAKKSADKLFRLDRFRIDPFVLGSSAEMTARLTLGKRISRNFFILYSTNLTAQREEITRIEWELTKDLSVVSTRDEYGRISIDIKIHKRF